MKTALLEKQAIKAAMSGAWKKAIKINQEILKLQPKNIAALNRLGRAFWENGELKKAEKIYRKVLLVDRYNPIALKNLRRLATLEKTQKPLKKTSQPLVGEIFLEEPGKTKTVKLVRLASPKVLSELDSADPVLLVPKRRTVSVLREDGTYLGALPDDLSQRLIKFIKGGSRFQAYVKVADRQHLEIFIHETFRSKKFRNIPPFAPPGRDHTPSFSPKLIHKERLQATSVGKKEASEG